MTTEARQLDPSVETWALEYPGELSIAAVDVMREQLQEALPGKRVVIVQDGGRFRALESLDAAWAEVEAALPEGVELLLAGDILRPPESRYEAEASARCLSEGPTGADWKFSADFKGQIAYGPTPAAALRALAAKLREIPA